MEQRVVCAAVRLTMNGKTLVITGARHYDKLMVACLNAISKETSDETQGFVDNYGEFLTREEAWVVAKKARQILCRVGGDGDLISGGKLFSENMY